MKNLFASELEREMNLALLPKVEKVNLEEAYNKLHSASSLLRSAGLIKQANDVMKVLVNNLLKNKTLVQKFAKAKKKKDKHTANLTSEKMVKNLKHHGTEFNLAEDNLDYNRWMSLLDDKSEELDLSHLDDNIKYLLQNDSDKELLNLDINDADLEVLEEEADELFDDE